MYLPSSGGATVRRPNIGSEGGGPGQALASLALLVVALLWGRESWAQTIVLNETGGIERQQPAYSSALPWWINLSDCLANDVFTFSLSLTGQTNPVEVWVGSDDCAANRSDGADHGQCWIVAREDTPGDIVDIPVPVRNIVARRLQDDAPTQDLPASVCDDPTDPNGEEVTFFFMIVDGGRSIVHDTWTGGIGGTGFDTLGPDPPGTVNVGVGERQLAISIGNFNEDDDLRRFEAFCVPQGTQGPPPEIPSRPRPTSTADAGAEANTADGGVDTSTGEGTDTSSVISAADAAPEECFTPIIATGARPPAGFGCGVVSKESGSLRTDVLENDIAYAVGVAGQDVLGNAGVVSDIQCGTPIPLNDFYEDYRANGGRGGGGFCGLSRAPVGSPTHGVAWLGVLVAGWLWRRTRPHA